MWTLHFHEELVACEKENRFRETGFSKIVLSRGLDDPVVFYDIEPLKKRWEALIKVLFIDQEAFDCQMALALSKTTFERR